MELHLSFPIATISIILIIFVFQILIQKRTNTRKNKNPPQVKGAWPIFGHLHLLGGSALPHRILGNLADTYGPIFTIKLGVHQALVVSDPEIAKECFTTNDKVFASRPKSLISEIMGYNYAMFPLSPYGEYWRQVRKMATVELLSQRRVEMLKDVRVSEIRTFMKDINEACTRNKRNMVKVEMREFFGNLVLNIITTTISGKRFSPGDVEAVEIHAVVGKFFKYLGTFVVSDFIPYVKFLDLGGHVKGMKLAAKEMDDIIEGWLLEHKKQRESRDIKEGQPDFMDTLISIVEGASKDAFPGYDNDTIIKSTSLVMITAGFETTAVALTWAIVLLLNNPETLKLAQKELDFRVGKERLVDESDIKNLVYLQAIVKETLRLYPPGPISITHASTDDCVVGGGYRVPKGTLLITNLWKIHHDPNAWLDPYEFRPERFLTDQKGIDVRGQHYELLPFGSGRRICPGISFAIKSLQLTLASLIQGFKLAKSTQEPVDTSEFFRQTCNKATPLEVLLSPRLSSNMYRVNA